MWIWDPMTPLIRTLWSPRTIWRLLTARPRFHRELGQPPSPYRRGRPGDRDGRSRCAGDEDVVVAPGALHHGADVEVGLGRLVHQPLELGAELGLVAGMAVDRRSEDLQVLRRGRRILHPGQGRPVGVVAV